MGAICVIVNFDGAPVATETLNKMAETGAYRGPDGIRFWSEGAVGMAHLAFHTTPEAVTEIQPLINRRGNLTLVADARVDNRDELIAFLTAKGYVQEKTPSDAALILAAYECWGEDCPKQIIGDFAFAIWDASERKLFCARDPVGIRLLQYAQVGQTLYVATAVGSILAALPARPEINLPLLQDFLTGEHRRWVYQTAYQGIARLPQSYAMTAQAGRIVLQRYWIWGEQPAVRYRRDEEYVDHFRELFEQAVLACLRTNTPLGIWTGGGLDSAAVTAMVDHLVGARNLDVAAYLYSAVFEYTPEADEREYAETLAESCTHLKGSRFLPSDECWGFKEAGRDDGYPLDEPEPSVDRSLTNHLCRAARQDGCRVGLSGEGADNILLQVAYFHANVFKDVPLRHLWQELPYFARYSGFSKGGTVARAYLRTTFPRLWQGLRRFKQASPGDPALCQPYPMPPEDFLPPPRLRSEGAKASYHELTKGHYSMRLACFDAYAAFFHLEERYPFFNRSLVEFALQLPYQFRIRNGLNKCILRNAMANLWPEKICQRRRGTHLTGLITRGLADRERERIRALLPDARVICLGLVEGDRLMKMWDDYWRSPEAYPFIIPARMLCVESWLRAQENMVK